jgi:hypothetical protein
MSEEDFIELMFKKIIEHTPEGEVKPTLETVKESIKNDPAGKAMLQVFKSIYNHAVDATYVGIPNLHKHYSSTEMANIIFSLRVQ